MTAPSFAADIEIAAGGEPIEAVIINKTYYDYARFAAANARAGKSLPWADARPLLDYEYDTGYGSQDCHDVEVFTATRVLFVHEYDGATSIASVRRHPMTAPGAGDPPRCDIPDDVLVWVRDTYKPAGIATWVRAWANADGNRRASMVAAARLPDGAA